MTDPINKFLNTVAVKRFVNVHFEYNQWVAIAPQWLTFISGCRKSEPDWYSLDVDIGKSPESEDEFPQWFRDQLNKELAFHQFPHMLREDDTVEDVLEELENILDRAGLLFAYPFVVKEPPDDKQMVEPPENQRILLSSIRKFIEMQNPRWLQIVMLSSPPVIQFDLFPNSLLDERQVALKQWPLENE